ncbi:hypothetical protein U2150_01900 [Methanothermobacter wolfeii]|uniref:Uncharacterized protein n=1 Tax=Methanothermobacter wolfeii TaxID=145261 RepID=A0ABU8TT94_METWO
MNDMQVFDLKKMVIKEFKEMYPELEFEKIDVYFNLDSLYCKVFLTYTDKEKFKKAIDKSVDYQVFKMAVRRIPIPSRPKPEMGYAIEYLFKLRD